LGISGTIDFYDTSGVYVTMSGAAVVHICDFRIVRINVYDDTGAEIVADRNGDPSGSNLTRKGGKHDGETNENANYDECPDASFHKKTSSLFLTT